MADIPITPLDAAGILSVLTRHEVDFVVIGGFSLAAHGAPRGTKDIDVVPAPDEENLDRLADALANLDAEIILADDFDPRELGIAPDADGLRCGGNWVLQTRLGRLDVLQVVSGVRSYKELRAGAVYVDVAGAGQVPFAGLDDLIAMKTAAGRPQDEIDITSLERARRGGLAG